MSDVALRKLDQIQVLRALAAVAVLLGHTEGTGIHGGFGVDLFFVISGFVIAYVTQSDTKSFFTKRIFRLVPLYWAGTVAVLCIVLVAPEVSKSVVPTWSNLLKSLFFIPFEMSGQVRPILVLGWTLVHEMFFYVLFAASLSISHKYRTQICSTFLFAIVLIGQAGDMGTMFSFESNSIILEFIFGMVAFGLWQKFHSVHLPRLGLVIMVAAASAIMLGCITFEAEALRVLWWGVPAFVAFVLFLRGARDWNFPPAIVIIGDASYSLYLFHPYVQNAVRMLIPAPEIILSVIGVVASIIFAIIIWRLFEAPTNRYLRKKFLHRQPPVIQQQSGE